MRSEKILKKIAELREHQLQFDNLFFLLDQKSQHYKALRELYDTLIFSLDSVEFAHNSLKDLVDISKAEPISIVNQCMTKLKEIESAGKELYEMLMTAPREDISFALAKTKKYLDRLHEIAPTETEKFFKIYQLIEAQITKNPVEARMGINALRSQIKSAIKEKLHPFVELHNKFFSERKEIEKKIKEVKAFSSQEIEALQAEINSNQKAFNTVNEEICKIVKAYKPKKYDYVKLMASISSVLEVNNLEENENKLRAQLAEEAGKEFLKLEHDAMREMLELKEADALVENVETFLIEEFENIQKFVEKNEFPQMYFLFLKEGVEKAKTWQEKKFFRDQLIKLDESTLDFSAELLEINAKIRELLINEIRIKQEAFLENAGLSSVLRLMNEDPDAINIVKNRDALDEVALVDLHNDLYRAELTEAFLHQKAIDYLNAQTRLLQEQIIAEVENKIAPRVLSDEVKSSLDSNSQDLEALLAHFLELKNGKEAKKLALIIDHAKQYANDKITDDFILADLDDFFENNNKENFSKKLIKQLQHPENFIRELEIRLYFEKHEALKNKYVEQFDLNYQDVKQLWPDRSLPIHLLFEKTEKKVFESDDSFKKRIRDERQKIGEFFKDAFSRLAQNIIDKNILSRIENAYHIDFNKDVFNQAFVERLHELRDSPIAAALLVHLENQQWDDSSIAKNFISTLVKPEKVAQFEDQIIYPVMIKILQEELRSAFLLYPQNAYHYDAFSKAMRLDVSIEHDKFKLEAVFLKLVELRQRLNPVVLVDSNFDYMFTQHEKEFFCKKLNEESVKFIVNAKLEQHADREFSYHVSAPRKTNYDEVEKAFVFHRDIKWLEKNSFDQSISKEGKISYKLQSELTSKGRETKTIFAATHNIPWRVGAVCAARDLLRLRELERANLLEKHDGMKSRFGDKDDRVIALKKQCDKFFPKQITLAIKDHNDKNLVKMNDSVHIEIEMPLIIKETIEAYFEAGFNHIEWEGKIFKSPIPSSFLGLFAQHGSQNDLPELPPPATPVNS